MDISYTNGSQFTQLELQNESVDFALAQSSTEIQNRDDLDPVHLEAYYSLQNQISNILENFEKRIEVQKSQ